MSSSSIANLSIIPGTNQGTYSFAKLTILPYSDDSDISSAKEPSADILAPAVKNCSFLLPAI